MKKRDIQLPSSDSLVSKSISDTRDKLSLQITLTKNKPIHPEQQKEIKDFIEDFMSRMDNLTKAETILSSESFQC